MLRAGDQSADPRSDGSMWLERTARSLGITLQKAGQIDHAHPPHTQAQNKETDK